MFTIRVGRDDLFLGHLSGIETRSHFALLLVCEPNENVGMLARLGFYGFIQGRQQRRTAPVVDDSITVGRPIKMRSDDDHPVGAAPQQTNDVR